MPVQARQRVGLTRVAFGLRAGALTFPRSEVGSAPFAPGGTFLSLLKHSPERLQLLLDHLCRRLTANERIGMTELVPLIEQAWRN
jgi:hypothetical protein